MKKKAAMEMSVGTIVTIVLLMTVLILGLILIRTIFVKSTNAIDEIDNQIQSEITRLFADEGKRIVIYPKEREVRMKKGSSGGFAFSIMNKEMTPGVFSYEVSVEEVSRDCQLTESQAEGFIVLGKSGSRSLGSGDSLENAILVKFQIPETAPLCMIRYKVEVNKDGVFYSGADIDLKII